MLYHLSRPGNIGQPGGGGLSVLYRARQADDTLALISPAAQSPLANYTPKDQAIDYDDAGNSHTLPDDAISGDYMLVFAEWYIRAYPSTSSALGVRGEISDYADELMSGHTGYREVHLYRHEDALHLFAPNSGLDAAAPFDIIYYRINNVYSLALELDPATRILKWVCRATNNEISTLVPAVQEITIIG